MMHQNKLDEISKAKALLDDKAISQKEFDDIKREILGSAETDKQSTSEANTPNKLAYSQLKWYRKSENISVFVLFGIFFPPLIWIVCFVLLSGDVYYDKVDDNGNFVKWGDENKVIAVLILAVQVLFLCGLFSL